MICSHNEVIKWKHFPCYCPFVQGIHRSPVNFPHKGQWRRALMLSVICVWINDWVNTREAGDFQMPSPSLCLYCNIKWMPHSLADDKSSFRVFVLTHWGRVMNICIGKLTIIGSDNGLSPGWRQAIIWNNAGLLLIRPLGTNLGEILIRIHIFSFKKIHLKMLSAKWHPFCISLNVLINNGLVLTGCTKKRSQQWFSRPIKGN